MAGHNESISVRNKQRLGLAVGLILVGDVVDTGLTMIWLVSTWMVVGMVAGNASTGEKRVSLFRVHRTGVEMFSKERVPVARPIAT